MTDRPESLPAGFAWTLTVGAFGVLFLLVFDHVQAEGHEGVRLNRQALAAATENQKTLIQEVKAVRSENALIIQQQERIIVEIEALKERL